MSGIDYGLGTTNIDNATGIRYGVIPANDVAYWDESAEPNYGDPTCPRCAADTVAFNESAHAEYAHSTEHGCEDWVCESCRIIYDSDECFGDEPLAYVLNDADYLATQGSDGDIFIERSPYYTRAQFCSPCAPGAVYLRNEEEDGEKAYCFDSSFFDSDNPCPYHYWSVADDSLVYSPEEV